MSAPVFLTYFDPAGAQRYIPLDRYDSTPTFYLPDTLVSDLKVSTQRNSQHFNIRLDVAPDHCLLSVYSDEIQPVIVLGNLEVEVPISTSAHQKSIVLTEEHQFITPISRWQVQWDRSGVISNSMRPPPRAFSEIQSDEEHVREFELLPSMDGDGLIDRQELSDIAIYDESGRTRIPVVDIHLSPKSSTASAEGEESKSRARTDSEGHIASVHLNTGGRDTSQPVGTDHMIDVQSEHSSADISSLRHAGSVPEREASSSATFDNGEDSISEDAATGDGLSGYDSEVPESPNAPPGQKLIKKQDRWTSILVVTPTHHIDTLSDDLDRTGEIQKWAQASTQRDEHAMDSDHHVDTEKEVEHGESEDESQLQKDTRIPKRRLSEIEDEEPPVNSKMAKFDDKQIRNTTSEELGGIITPANALKIAKEAAETSVVVAKLLRSTSKSSKEREKMPLPLKNARQSRTPSISARYSAIVKTPTRRSSRKSETPVSSSPALQSGSKHGGLKVIFSSASEILKTKNILPIIEKLGGVVVDSIHDADVLCIGPGALKKTSKLIIAIARGIDIVTDDWVKQAQKNQTFPPCKDFLPRDRHSEKEWGFSLSKALKRGKSELKFLDRVDVYLTTQVRKDLGNLTKDLKQVASALGAVKVHAGLPSRKSQEHVLVIGSTKNIDPEGAKVNRLGHKLYVQDLLTMGVLRGKLELDSKEFVIDVPVKDEPTSSQ